MGKHFNVTGLCYPDKHYMVNLDSRLKQVRTLIENGDYFIINRARQFGKTTLLKALSLYLQDEYSVISLDFQQLSTANFQNEYTFSAAFTDAFISVVYNKRKKVTGLNLPIIDAMGKAADNMDMRKLFEYLCKICATAEKPLILMIDEVDTASNNQVFLDFLAQLRFFYLDREDTPTFQSVILAGVYDIKNLKQKIRGNGEHKYNSPWNIAAEFTIDMSFSPSDIAGMLKEYEEDQHTGMDIPAISRLIYDYTSGYPFLVSRICKIIDEQMAGRDGLIAKSSAWTVTGVTEAVRELLKESNTLFDDMIKKLKDYPELERMLREILFNGQTYAYNPYNHAISIGKMFGFIAEKDGAIIVANRIFETQLYNYFISEEMTQSPTYRMASLDKNQFIQNGHLNMDLIMKKFIQHFTDVYGDNDNSFIEENGRRLFLLYLKPIINGVGNYYIEARTRDMRRTDIIVDYLGEQFVIELKIWHGDEYNNRGKEQLADYLNTYHLNKGYLLSFSFNKNKVPGLKEIKFGGKTIIEAVV